MKRHINRISLIWKTIFLLLFLGCIGKHKNTSDANFPESINSNNEDSIFSAKTVELPDLYKKLKSDEFLGKVTVETLIEDKKVFTEGPAVDGNGMVYFSNVAANKILKWDPVQKKMSVFKSESNGTNGLRFTMDGNLLVCEGGSGTIAEIDMDSGAVRTIASLFNGKGLQSPNDLDLDSSGRIYFSSRTGNPDLEKENKKALYRIDLDGSVHQLLSEPEIQMPNGVAISPDDKSLYLIESHADIDHARKILVFDLHRDGSISNSRTLFDFYPGRSGDGMSVDNKGNLYVAAGLHAERGTSETLDTPPGIHVISPKGELLAYAKTPPGIVTNCSFGGGDLKTLYVTDGKYLLSIRTKIPGKPSYRPKVD